MNSKNQDTMPALNNADALSLLAYLLTSAEGCLKEPLIYGVHRLATAAVKGVDGHPPPVIYVYTVLYVLQIQFI